MNYYIIMGYSSDQHSEQPLCYSDRQTWKDTDRYMFISYAHKDSEIVYSDLFVLYKNCLNYWYDKQLSAGDEWDVAVEHVIRDPKCAGIILYFSLNMVKSAACEKEIRIYKEIVAQGRKDFKLIPISVDGISVNATVREAYMSCAQLTPDELDAKLPPERVSNILDNIKSTVMYLNRNVDGFHLTKVLELLRSYDENLFCSDDVALNKLSRLPVTTEENGVTYIRLGTYPQDRIDGEYAVSNDVRDTAGGRITVKNGHGYKHSSLKWIILRNNNSEALAISEFVLDKLRKDEIDDFLAAFKDRVMSENSVSDCIEKVSLPDLGVLAEYSDIISENDETDYCRSYPKNTIWAMYWGERNERTVAYYKKNTPMVAQIANNVICGIRPCITINIDKLLKKYQIT